MALLLLTAVVGCGPVANGTQQPGSGRSSAPAPELSLLPGESPTPESTDPDPLIGTWTGSYSCGIERGLRLEVQANPVSDPQYPLVATFTFYPMPTGPTSPSDSYTMVGSYQNYGGDVSFRQNRWVNQPPGYVMVDLVGSRVRRGENLFVGRVTSMGCTNFVVTPEG